MRFFLNLIFTIMLTNTAFSQSAFSADEQAIHQIVQDLQDGWNAKSGEQWAAHFADDHRSGDTARGYTDARARLGDRIPHAARHGRGREWEQQQSRT